MSTKLEPTSGSIQTGEEKPFLLDDDEPKKKSRCECKGCHKRAWATITSWTWKTWLRLGIIFALIVAIVLVLTLLRHEVKDGLSTFLHWIKYDVRWWGPPIMALVYIPCTVLFVPGLILTLGAGYAFNSLPPVPVLWGTVSVSVGSTLGACLAFLLGRSLVRSWIEEKVQKYKMFAAVDNAIGQQGWFIVFLIRLSPVLPFNVVNYGLALTKVKFWHYALASWIGMLPGTIMYVYIGGAAENISEIISGNYHGGTKTKVLFYCGLGAALAVVVVITIIAKRAINKALREANPEMYDADGNQVVSEEGSCSSGGDVCQEGDEWNPPTDSTTPLLA